MEEKSIRVGIGVMVLRDGMVLLGKRKGAHGEGEYAFPGGHLEYMESYEECARRETREETGLEIENLVFQYLANVKDFPPRHYVHIGMTAESKDGTPQVCEPDKKESWDWYALDDLPEPLFAPCINHFESYRSGRSFYDA